MTAAQPSETEEPLAELVAPGVLRAQLATAFAAVRRKRVTVAVRCGAHVMAAAVGDDGNEPADRAAPVGCVMKLVTAELVYAAVAARRFELGTEVAELLGSGVPALRGVTVRQLLEHTHGLDDSLLEAPRYRVGCIDRADFLERAARLERWSPPGACYSYGHLGAWLAAAVLERVRACPFAALVRAELLAPLGMRPCAVGDEPLCAATGRGLALTAEDLVRLSALAPSLPSKGAAGVTPLPGWHPLERGIHRGWKHAGGGWFGHQSVWPGASAYVRAHAVRGVALAVLSRDQPAAGVAARLFGARLAELFDLRVPLRAGGGAAPAAPAGRYAEAACVVRAERTAAGLEAVVHTCGHGRAEWRAVLEAAAGDIWLARPPREALPYAQLVTSGDGRSSLWNGRRVLRAT